MSSPDFNLPDEILAVIPTDPFEQLEVARKITSMAISSRVVDLDLEVNRLRQRIADKDLMIDELKDEVGRLEAIVQDADARLREVIDQNAKLSKEREKMEITVKKLNKDLTKLENFKKHLMETLSEDVSDVRDANIGNLDSVSSNQTNSKVSVFKGDEILVYGSSDLVPESTQTRNIYQLEPNTGDQKSSLTPYISSSVSPSTTPKVTSSKTSPKAKRYSATGTPQMASGVTSPIKTRIDGKIVISPWFSSSQISSASSSPPTGRSLPGRTRIDGKEFFRQARNRLSYEQFAAFLANIKEFNAHKQSREETLKKADEIFGIENEDLYSSFQGLLTRNLP